LFCARRRGRHAAERLGGARLPRPQVVGHPFEPVHGGRQRW